ncbi:tetratricopeptide repeat protein [Roseateles sp. SL47]|uniref:tetratricopeptide repeat protein n=1 Tax=Roseateles sp. SL47 TaxID=2995138 RepID=UPI00226EF5E4|nr:tetratricopeptide repeat protein [Roseateles sp. SL47]WAC71142.1 tetratricopeptide repeat protein [Roseateles sp. SL47]
MQTLLDAGQADQLEKLASQRLKATPDDPQATAALALSQLDLADGEVLRQNIQRLEQCVQKTPQEASCSYALALALVMQVRGGSKFKALGALGRVSELLQKAMSQLPDAPEPRSALQQYYLALPSFVGGGESKARGLEQGVQDSDQLHLLRARAAASKKDWASVERELRAVRTRRPELLLEQRVLGSDLGRQWMHDGQHAKAKAWLEELARQQPQQAMPLYGLGRVLDAMGDHDAAVATYEKAKSLNGAEQLALDHRIGIALQDKGDKAGARAAFERYLTHRRASASNIEDCKRRLAEIGAAG